MRFKAWKSGSTICVTLPPSAGIVWAGPAPRCAGRHMHVSVLLAVEITQSCCAWIHSNGRICEIMLWSFLNLGLADFQVRNKNKENKYKSLQSDLIILWRERNDEFYYLKK